MRHIDNPSSANILPGDCIVATSAQRAALSIGPEDAGKVIVEKDSGRMYLATMTEGAKPLSTNLAAELAEIGITSNSTFPLPPPNRSGAGSGASPPHPPLPKGRIHGIINGFGYIRPSFRPPQTTSDFVPLNTVQVEGWPEGGISARLGNQPWRSPALDFF